MLEFLVENPPVAIVAKEWLMESNQDIPANTNNTICKTVNPTYICQSFDALSLIRGNTLSAIGPGTSALNRCTARAPNLGKKTMNKTMIPMPPSQWVRLRHSNKLLGRNSTLSMTLAPVVVRPETASNNPSM